MEENVAEILGIANNKEVHETPTNKWTAKEISNEGNTDDLQHKKSTTDTGYSNEIAVAGYADIVFACATIGCIAIYIAIIIMAARISDSAEATIYIAFFGLIVTTIYIVVFYIAKAFIKIYANISINLHEINMKLK